MAKRISIINFKGGVGKTTLAFHLATGLERFYAANVLLVDVDHQSSLSVLCMGDEGWKSAVGEKRTVAEIFEWLVGNRSGSSRPSDEIIIKGPLPGYPRLDIIPSSLALDDLEIQLTTSQEIRLTSDEMGSGFTADWDKRTSICRWIEGTRRTRVDDEYDYVIFDCPPATKIVSQNAIAASHGYIVPVIPEAVMQRGVPHLVNLIGFIDRMICRQSLRSPQLPRERRGRNVWVRNTKFAGLVVTSIKSGAGGYTKSHTTNITQLQEDGDLGRHLVRPFITETTLVDDAQGDGVPVYDLSESAKHDLRDGDIDRTYEELVDNIKSRIDNL